MSRGNGLLPATGSRTNLTEMSTEATRCISVYPQLQLFLASALLSDRQYGFRKGRSTGGLLSLLTDSWSSSLSRFGETFSVALDISKAFDRDWHESLLFELPSFCFYSSLCSFLSSFLSGRTISAVVDGQCSSPKSFSSGVPQGLCPLTHSLPVAHQ